MAAKDQGGQGGAPGEGAVTLEALRDGLNALSGKFNQLLAAFQASDERLAQQEMEVRELRGILRDQTLRPQVAPGGAGGIGGAAVPGDIQVLLTQMQDKIAALENRPLGAITAAEQKKLGDAALKRESHAHQADQMMYHKDPGALKVTRVVASDAEAKAAVAEGYYPTLDAAARAGLAADATQAQVDAQIEKLRRAMFKVA